MRAVILKCKSGSQFHFGRYAPDSDTALNDTSDIIHSDTLFSALVNYYDSIYSDTDAFVNEFKENRINISSVYFCLIQGQKQVWFLPKPITFNLLNLDDYKSFKRIKYISKKLWESIKEPEEFLLRKDIVVLQGIFAMQDDEIKMNENMSSNEIRVFHSVTLPKVHVHKPTDKDSIYQQSNIEIADNSHCAQNLEVHYYFLYEISADSSFKKKFEQILSILEYEGIGAERSTIGKLEGVEDAGTWEISHQTETDFAVTVSLLSPKQEELEKLTYYETIFRGGRRIGIDRQYLKSLRMIVEGAIVKTPVKGDILTISPEEYHGTVFKRNGMCLSIPINKHWVIQENE